MKIPPLNFPPRFTLKIIIQLIEHCTCKTKKIWQAKQDIGTTTNESDIFAEKAVTTYQKYGDCDGVGIDLLMLFDQQNVDLREQKEEKENVYPSAIIPLSTRSQYLLPLTRTGEGAIVFSANEKRKARVLLGDICTAVVQPAIAPEKEQEMMKKAAKTKDQLKVKATRIEYKKKLRAKIRQKRQGGKKTHKRRKKRTKRKTHKKRKRKRRKTRRKRH